MKRFILILLIFFSLCSMAFAKTLSRNETVYVTLNAQGKPEKMEVVTWLRTDSLAPSQDVTMLKKVKNIRGMEAPALSADGKLTFNSPVRDIFYSGVASKSLPVTVKIQYRLNGKPLKRTEINGKSGKLEVIIDLENQTHVLQEVTYKEIGTGKVKSVRESVSVPFIVTISTDLDIEQFNDVVAPDGAFAVVGRTMKMNWICFPYPATTIKLSADIQNARIPSILFTVIPKYPPLPEIDIASKLNQIYAGVDTVGSNLVKLENGANALANGQEQMLAALEQVHEGTGMLLQASNAQMEIINGGIKINEEISAGMMPLTKIPLISGDARKARHYLDIQKELLVLAAQGGPFSNQVLNFFKEQGKEAPPVKEFPGIKVTVEGITMLNQVSLAMIEGSKKLADGSRTLQTGVSQVKAQGTDKIKSSMAAGADPLLRKLASIQAAKQLVLKYDRFMGGASDVKSSVEIIMKTPDE